MYKYISIFNYTLVSKLMYSNKYLTVIMGADGHVYVFVDAEDWFQDMITTLYCTAVPSDVEELCPNNIYCNGLFHDIYGPGSFFAYWDTDNYDLVVNDTLDCISQSILENLKKNYYDNMGHELDTEMPPSDWMHKYLARLCLCQEQIWT